MTTIKLSANDQVLSIVTQPKIASGDINSVLLQVDFDDGWDGYKRTAVFFTSLDETVYKADLTDDQCIVPYEVLAEPGTLFIGVRGVKSDNTVKTTILVKYKIELGAPNGVKEPGDIPPGGGGDPGGTIDPARIPDMYYTEDGEMVEILPETEGIFFEDMGGFGFMGTPLSLVEGNPYTVKYNGADFECVATKMEMGEDVAIGLGDTGALAGEPTGSFPFLVVVADMLTSMGVACGVIPLDGSTNVTLSLLGKSEKIHHIPPKYIKDMYYEEEGLIEIISGDGLVMGSDTHYTFDEYYELVAGNEYVVNWRGKEYTCMAVDASAMMDGAIALGDIYTMSSGSIGTPTGEPFCILKFANGDNVTGQTFCFPLDGLTYDLNVIISEKGAIYHTIPEKYIPDSIIAKEINIGECGCYFELNNSTGYANLPTRVQDAICNQLINNNLKLTGVEIRDSNGDTIDFMSGITVKFGNYNTSNVDQDSADYVASAIVTNYNYSHSYILLIKCGVRSDGTRGEVRWVAYKTDLGIIPEATE